VQVRRDEPDGTVNTFPVPVHAARNLKKGILKGILRKADLTADELARLL
jgi:predicted RNA binding protein YcfA (HicA-like mRNA interferase family)